MCYGSFSASQLIILIFSSSGDTDPDISVIFLPCTNVPSNIISKCTNQSMNQSINKYMQVDTISSRNGTEAVLKGVSTKSGVLNYN